MQSYLREGTLGEDAVIELAFESFGADDTLGSIMAWMAELWHARGSAGFVAGPGLRCRNVGDSH